jgi:hypothetical protein
MRARRAGGGQPVVASVLRYAAVRRTTRAFSALLHRQKLRHVAHGQAPESKRERRKGRNEQVMITNVSTRAILSED